MKELNILESNATIKQLQKQILLNTRGQYMKDPNILADNATIKQLQKEVLVNTRGQYMKEKISWQTMQLSSNCKRKSW